MCFLHFIFEKTTRPSVIQSEKITSLIKVTACFLCLAVTSERVCGRKSIQWMFKCTLSSTVCKDKVNDLELFMFASLQPPFLLFLCFNFALTVWSELLQYGASLCRRARSRRMVWWWSYQTDDNLLLLCAVGEDDQCQISNPLAVNIQRKWKHLKDSVEKWI